MTKLKPSVQLH